MVCQQSAIRQCRIPTPNIREILSVESERSKIFSRKRKTQPNDCYRSTSVACKFSPAQLLIGRKIRNSVPMLHTKLNPQWPDLDKVQAREAISKLKQQSTFNNRHKAIPLTPLEPGTEVHVKDLERPGLVVKPAETLRSYWLKPHQHSEEPCTPDTNARSDQAATNAC